MSKTTTKPSKPKTPKGRSRKLDLDNLIRLYLSEMRSYTRARYRFGDAAIATQRWFSPFAVSEKLKIAVVGKTDGERTRSMEANKDYCASLLDDMPARLCLVWGRAMQDVRVRR